MLTLFLQNLNTEAEVQARKLKNEEKKSKLYDAKMLAAMAQKEAADAQTAYYASLMQNQPRSSHN